MLDKALQHLNWTFCQFLVTHIGMPPWSWRTATASLPPSCRSSSHSRSRGGSRCQGRCWKPIRSEHYKYWPIRGLQRYLSSGFLRLYSLCRILLNSDVQNLWLIGGLACILEMATYVRNICTINTSNNTAPDPLSLLAVVPVGRL